MRWFLDNAANVEAVAEMLMGLASLAAFVAMFLIRRSTPSRTEVQSMIADAVDPVKETAKSARTLAEQARKRLDEGEKTMSQLASKDDVSQILQTLARQDGDRRALAATVEGIKESLVRIEQPLDLLMQEAMKGKR